MVEMEDMEDSKDKVGNMVSELAGNLQQVRPKMERTGTQTRLSV